MSDLARKLSGLSPDQRRLAIARMRRRGLAVPPELAEMMDEATEGRRRYPLSHAQRRLWFLNQVVPAPEVFNLPTVLRLDGEIRPRYLEKAFHEIVARHEVLRTAFREEAGELVQEILPSIEVPLEVIGLDAEPSPEEVEALVRREVGKPFDLGRPPLLRTALFRWEANHHLLVLVMHHIVTDGWSFGVLVEELATVYQALLAGRPSPLPPLPVQYGVIAESQQSLERNRELDEQLEWWVRRLKDAPRGGLLPAAKTGGGDHRGSSESFSVPASLATALRELGRNHGASLFMTLLAAFKVLLFRYSWRWDQVVGSPVACRNERRVEPLIGYFVNMLVLRTDLSGDPTFAQVLSRVRETVSEALARQETPFEKIVGELGIERQTEATPLISVVFVLQTTPLPDVELPGLRVASVEVDRGAAQFDLLVEIVEGSGDLDGSVEYRTGLFTPEVIRHLTDHFLRLLQSVVERPECRLSRLPLLSAEASQELDRIGRTIAKTPAPPATSLAHMFRETVRRFPDRSALVWEGSSWTYRHLDERSDLLASALQAQGVRRGDFVALFVSRGPSVVLAILGILKAGAAYVPLDPANPLHRLELILDDTRPAQVVTDSEMRDKLPDCAAELLCLDSLASPNDLPALKQVAAGPDDPAYVIYTSGSTGRPKGVVVSHGNVGRLFSSCSLLFGWGPDEIWTLFHSYAFDFSVWEIWGPLLSGGRLVVLDSDVVLDPQSVIDLLERERVTIFSQTPSAFGRLLTVRPSDDDQLAPSLRYVVFGGEALDFELLRSWLERRGDDRPRMINMYGITETTVHVTFRRVLADETGSGAGSRIGAPLPDLRVHLLDPYLRPQPFGAAGEVFVSGAGLAQGYLRQPSLTAERFLPSPWGEGERLYRTGDLARWVADRDLEFLGRIDGQVQVRGYRVELGEIEAALCRHPQVAQAAATVQQIDGEEVLGSWVVSRGSGSPLDPEELRSFLSGRLPQYMRPSFIAPLDQLPVTVNGKIDRAALVALEQPGRGLSAAYEPPRTEEERKLAESFSRVLGVERVGVDDDFFDLGGHSLLAVRLVADLRATCGIEIDVRQLFARPTVASISRFLRRREDGGEVETTDLVPPRIVLSADALLDPAIRPTEFLTAAPSGRARLLTGATGFLGVYLLSELLQAGQWDVYCLVRAEDDHAALDRLRNGLEQYELWHSSFEGRIRGLAGDLGLPRLGLTESHHDAMIQTIGAIYHSGAQVNLTYPYKALRPANVDGTREILRLATQGPLKSVHHVSTTGVLLGQPENGEIDEATPVAPTRFQGSGYAATKWVAERLVLEAGSRGVPTTIYRPGRITGDTRGGRLNPDDLFTRTLGGCIEAGVAPALDGGIEMLPVDFVARSIVALSQQPESGGRTFHLVHPKPLPWVNVLAEIRRRGYSVREVEVTSWLEEVSRALPEDHALLPLLPAFVGGEGVGAEDSESTRIDSSATLRTLEEYDLRPPPADEALLGLYLDYMQSSGLIGAPPGVGASSCPDDRAARHLKP